MKFAKVTLQWMAGHGLLAIPTMRKSKDGTECILHEEYLSPYREEMEVKDFPIYNYDDQEFRELLNSPSWSWSEEEQPEGSSDFIQVAAAHNVLMATKAGIQTMSLSDNEALKVKDMYPEWKEYIGKSLSNGMKVQYDSKLYRVRMDVPVVLEHQFPSIDTAALYEEINESAAGTFDDPIPYNNNMALEMGKYYIQSEVIYKCTRSTGQAVYNPLADLVGIYVEVAEQA